MVFPSGPRACRNAGPLPQSSTYMGQGSRPRGYGHRTRLGAVAGARLPARAWRTRTARLETTSSIASTTRAATADPARPAGRAAWGARALRGRGTRPDHRALPQAQPAGGEPRQTRRPLQADAVMAEFPYQAGGRPRRQRRRRGAAGGAPNLTRTVALQQHAGSGVGCTRLALRAVVRPVPASVLHGASLFHSSHGLPLAHAIATVSAPPLRGGEARRPRHASARPLRGRGTGEGGWR